MPVLRRRGERNDRLCRRSTQRYRGRRGREGEWGSIRHVKFKCLISKFTNSIINLAVTRISIFDINYKGISLMMHYIIR